MGHQIIKQPDGLLAVFSSVTDSWILYDATPEELLEEYAARAAEDARERVSKLITKVQAGESAYYQFTMTFAEAQTLHAEHGHEPVVFDYQKDAAD